MLNKSGIERVAGTNSKQILVNVNLQSSIGCKIAQAVGVVVDNKRIAKAGTPIAVDLVGTRQSEAYPADATGNPMNAVLLHDVDVTFGSANATALIFGFVNLNRLDPDVITKIAQASSNESASKLLTFIRA